MSDHWKDVTWFIEHDADGEPEVWMDKCQVDVARAKDAEAIAALHDIIAAYEAVTDPEQHPDLFARSSSVLEDCRNSVCADQVVVQDLRGQVAAKDAEIASLRQRLGWFTAYPCHWTKTEVEYRTDCGQIAFPGSATRSGQCHGCWRPIVV